MSLADYLAKNYLNAEKKQKKHKRRKLDIVEDEDEGNTSAIRESSPPPPTATKSSKGWKRVGESLSTVPEVSEKQQQQQQETIYRDASGRRIDIALAKAEAIKRINKEKMEKEKQEKEMNLGVIQMRQEKERAKQLESAHNIKISDSDRSALDQELRAKTVWNDPAAKFLSQSTKQGTTSTTANPSYKGDFAPNRFGIPPGYRWDGVDRSNHFEQRWFAKQQERIDRHQMRYAAQEDM